MTTQDEGIFEMGKESGTSMAGGVGNVFRPQKEDEEVTGRLCLSRLVAYPVSALPLLLKPRNTSDSFAARSGHDPILAGEMEAEIYWRLTKRDQLNWHVCDGCSPSSSWNRRPEARRGTVLLLPQGDKPEDENHRLEMAEHKDRGSLEN